MAKKNPVNMVEWQTKDSARLKSFYGGVFRWKFDEVAPGHYTMVNTGNDELAGAICQLGEEPAPTRVVPYIVVDDLGESEQQIRALGGQVIISKHEVPGFGWFSSFTDPDGNTIGLWQDLPKKQRKAAKKDQKAKKKASKKDNKKQKKKTKR
jgi:hypothetical protein